MNLEPAARHIIKLLEILIIATVYIYYLILYIECFTKTYILLAPFYIYILSLSLWYYTVLLRKSPGSLSEYTGLEIRGVCIKCNRMKSSRTFHCDSCDKCYYKRDHHCPWVGKCIAAGNYKEFYFFIMFFVLFLGMRLVKGGGNSVVAFFNNYLFVILLLFFIWVNFLLCIDRTSIEYHKRRSGNTFFKYSNPWSQIDFAKFKERLYVNCLDGERDNAILVVFPFLYRKANVVS